MSEDVNNAPIRPSVLVVDDTPAKLVATRAVLLPLDVDVVEAASGAEALERVKQRPFAVALIDVQMPQVDGFQLARRLRESPEGAELPVVFVPLEVDVLRQRVRAFAELFRRHARHEAEVSERAEDELVASVAHELRAPVTSIVGWTVLARRLPVGRERDAALETVERNARLLKRLVEDLNDMSRSKNGRLRVELRDVAVDDALRAVVATFAAEAEQKGVRLELDVRAGTIRADAHRVRQITSRLLASALDRTPRGGTIFVTARRKEDGVEIGVRDTGDGLARDGARLGLTVVERLVAALGGSLRAEGTGVFVVLPAFAKAGAAERHA